MFNKSRSNNGIKLKYEAHCVLRRLIRPKSMLLRFISGLFGRSPLLKKNKKNRRFGSAIECHHQSKIEF